MKRFFIEFLKILTRSNQNSCILLVKILVDNTFLKDYLFINPKETNKMAIILC